MALKRLRNVWEIFGGWMYIAIYAPTNRYTV